MSYSNPSPAAIADINTTPLVDVMLVLLIIFMISTPLLSQRLPVALPTRGAEAVPAPPQRTVDVQATVDGQARVLYQGSVVDLTTLIQLLRRDQAEAEFTVNLKTAMELPYGELVRVVAAVRRAGVQQLRFDEVQAH
ncbi:MAG: biopolymer transporter ExbD [Xanthomonadales bacterium]|jgi:biopolymer transport protein ExbD|nr:biopolymer transporter ExbD [Xanthomonadales bacterium]